MDLEHLQLFVLVADLGSLSKAAIRSDLSASALSRKLGALEAECNGNLLHRTGRGVKLTSLGERILPMAKTLLEQATSLKHEMRASASVCSGTVHIGCVPALVSPVLTRVVRLVRERFPHVVVHAAEGYPNQIEQWLVDGKVDLGFVLRKPPDTSEKPLAVARLCLVGAKQDRMTERTEVDFRALDGLPLLQPAAPSTFRSAIAETARQLGITLNIVAEIDSVHLMKEMAAAGVGYGLLSKTAVLRELRNGELSATPIVNPEIVRTIYLGTSPRKTESRATRELAQLIRQVAEQMAQSGEWGGEEAS
jgi:LysR family nitrogen assimilation transcriptional regulator